MNALSSATMTAATATTAATSAATARIITYTTDLFGHSSGFGDRFSAWVALFAAAALLGDHVLLTSDQWYNMTISKVAGQRYDVQNALDCLLLPPHVLRSREQIPPDAKMDSFTLRVLFGPRKALPQWTPGFPQWAIPNLAQAAFNLEPLLLHNVSLDRYLRQYRETASSIAVAPRCTPPDAASLEGVDALKQDSIRAQRRGLFIAVHLRRTDAWDLRHVHGKGIIVDDRNLAARGAHHAMLLASLQRIGALLLEAMRNATRPADGHETKRDEHGMPSPRAGGRVTWLVLSDSANASQEVASTLRALPGMMDAASPSTSSLGGRPLAPHAWRVAIAPTGYGVWSFLAMRNASGIISSSLRMWSSFSCVPALMGDVPLFSISAGTTFKTRAVRYAPTGILDEFSAKAHGEAAFVSRMLAPQRHHTLKPNRQATDVATVPAADTTAAAAARADKETAELPVQAPPTSPPLIALAPTVHPTLHAPPATRQSLCETSTDARAVPSARAKWPANSSATAIAMLDSCRAAAYPLTSALATRYFAEQWWPSPSACAAATTRFGPKGEGGKVVCAASEPRSLGASDCLVVSVGLNDDTRAEQGLHAAFPQCTIHGYDGTLSAANRAKLPSASVLRFFPSNFGPTSFEQYEGRVVSLLKIDCEGCELSLLANWLDHVCTEQIALEVHGCSRMRYAVGNAATRLSLVHALMLRLDREYILFHREGNPRFPDGCLELSWRRRQPCKRPEAALTTLEEH